MYSLISMKGQVFRLKQDAFSNKNTIGLWGVKTSFFRFAIQSVYGA